MTTPTDESTTSSHPAPQAPDAATETGIASSDAASAAELAGLKRRLHGALRQFPDFPTPGVLFEDILPIFRSATLHADLVRALELFVGESFGGGGQTAATTTKQPSIDVVVGLEARGFLFGPSLALRLGAGFVPVRKRGKLPGATERASYAKEYGVDEFEVQADAIRSGQRVLVVDDIIATGGSAAAAGSLVEKLGGTLLGYVFVLELDFLKGREKLRGTVRTLLSSQSGTG